jgi:hypothetical protein
VKQRTPGSKRVITALVPLGALGAAVAGCGGGGGNATVPHQPATQPNSTTPNSSKNGTTTALITITIPARGALSQKAKRSVKYISQASAAIGVSVGATGAPSPAPTYFSLPTPGPQPTSTTLPVGAPIGNDTVNVSIYDALPSATASPNVLSRGTTTATVASGSSQPIAVQALGVAAGVVLGSAAPASFEVFENHPVAQTTSIPAQPVDADGYAITGTLASPVPLTPPAGVTVSPATLTAAGPVTLTYAASQYALGGALTAGLPLDTAPNSLDNFSVLATQYFFVVSTNGSMNSSSNIVVTAIDPVRQTVVGSVQTTEPNNAYSAVGLAGCAGGEAALFARVGGAAGGAAAEASFPVPGASAAPAATDLTGVIGTNSAGTTGTMLASDAACGAYSAGDGAAPQRYTGFGATAGVTAASLGVTGWTANSSLAIVGSTLYGTNLTVSGGSPPVGVITRQSAPLGGNAAASAPVTVISSYGGVTDLGICVGGTTAYELIVACTTEYLYATPSDASTQLNSAQIFNCAVAPNGTTYLFTGATATAQPSPFIGLAGKAGGVMTDGRYLAVASYTAPLTVQIYSVPAAANAAPVPVGTPIPLPTGQAYVNAAAFPH